MISRVIDRFRRAFRNLPVPIQRKAREVFRLFRQDPYNPLLHLKQVHKTKPIYSIRISLGWRALAFKSEGQMIWFWIGSHADYDKLLKQIS